MTPPRIPHIILEFKDVQASQIRIYPRSPTSLECKIRKKEGIFMKKHPFGLLSMLMAIMLIVTGCPSEPVAVTSITLDRTEISIAIGSSVKLTATTAPADAEVGTEITWASSNPEIVEVDRDGNATAKSLGEATITVKTANGLTATCKVTVVPVMATQISLSSETLKMEVSSEETLTVTFTPSNTTDRTIEWASSVPEVAKVENGKIIALKEGEAVISARTANGIEAKCKVTVVPVMAAKITLSSETLEMEVASEETLTVTFTPSNTTDRTIEWFTGEGYEEAQSCFSEENLNRN